MRRGKSLVMFFALLYLSCTQDDLAVINKGLQQELIAGEYKMWNFSNNGESVRLFCGIDTIAKSPMYSWFEVEGEVDVELKGQTNNYLDTGVFDETKIKNLKCRETYMDESDSLITKEFLFHVAYTGLPAIYITTENEQQVTKEAKIPGSFAIGGGGKFDNLENIILKINGRGNSSWYLSTKRSYNLKFDKKSEICGMPKSKKWALIDNYHDRSLLRNRYVAYINHNVFTNLGWNPSYVPCDFVLNGEYKGSYVIAERNKIESNRLNLADISEVSDITKGAFLCEIDERFDEVRHFRTTHGINDYNGNLGIAICLKEPDEVSDEVFDYVKLIVQNAEDALFSKEFKDEEKGYANYFDVNALVDWYLIHEFVCMYDASSFYTSAFFYYNPDDKKIHMGPCWDYDTSMRREDPGIELRKINSWYKRLFEDDYFNDLVKLRWNEKKAELRESFKVLDRFADEIRVSADYNFMRWQILGTFYEGQDTWIDLKTYQDQVEFLKDWVNERYALVDSVYGE